MVRQLFIFLFGDRNIIPGYWINKFLAADYKKKTFWIRKTLFEDIYIFTILIYVFPFVPIGWYISWIYMKLFWKSAYGCLPFCERVMCSGGMRHTVTALYFYRASKKNVHKPTASLWINLLERKYVLTDCLQLWYLRFLSHTYFNS
jgi:hypothetical protein